MLVKELKITDVKNLDEVGELLDQNCESNILNNVNWDEFPYKPKVEFKIGHNSKNILLKYAVTEKHAKALETKTNGDVYKDSCVEFFISFDKVSRF